MTRTLAIAIAAAALACGRVSSRGADGGDAGGRGRSDPAAGLRADGVGGREGGLSPGDVFAVTQDAEGYLWLGTPSGLLRFDGYGFASWASLNDKEPLPTGPVHALVSGHDGSMWVGLGGGGGVRPHPARPPHPLHDRQPARLRRVTAMIEDRQGVVWVAARRGLYPLRRQRVDAPERRGRVSRRRGVLIVRGSRRRAVGGHGGRRLPAHDEHVRAGERQPQRAEPGRGLRRARSGSPIRTKSIRRLYDGRAPRADASVRLPASGWRLLGDRRGQVWVAAFGGGLMRLLDTSRGAPAIERFAYEHRLAGSPRSLYEDRDGNVWVGMRGGLRAAVGSVVRQQHPARGRSRTTACAPPPSAADGSVWVATGHSLNRFDKGAPHRLQRAADHGASHRRARRRCGWPPRRASAGWSNGRFVPEPITPSLAVEPRARDHHRYARRALAVQRAEGRDGVGRHACCRVSSSRPTSSTAPACRWSPTAATASGSASRAASVAVHDSGTFQVFGERDGLAPGSVLGLPRGQERRRVGGDGGRREPLPERPLHRRSRRPTRRSWTWCRCSSRTTKATSGWASIPASASSASTRARWIAWRPTRPTTSSTRSTTRPTACSRHR